MCDKMSRFHDHRPVTSLTRKQTLGQCCVVRASKACSKSRDVTLGNGQHIYQSGSSQKTDSYSSLTREVKYIEELFGWDRRVTVNWKELASVV